MLVRGDLYQAGQCQVAREGCDFAHGALVQEALSAFFFGRHPRRDLRFFSERLPPGSPLSGPRPGSQRSRTCILTAHRPGRSGRVSLRQAAPGHDIANISGSFRHGRALLRLSQFPEVRSSPLSTETLPALSTAGMPKRQLTPNACLVCRKKRAKVCLVCSVYTAATVLVMSANPSRFPLSSLPPPSQNPRGGGVKQQRSLKGRRH